MANYNEPFKWLNSCCGDPITGQFGELAAEYWEEAFRCVDPLWNKAFAAEIYGNDPQPWYNKMNSFTYLFGMLALFYNDLVRSAGESLCGVPDYETIVAQYNFTCLEEAFKCMGCSVDVIPNIFTIFGLDSTNWTPFLDGIEAMYIEGGGPDCPGGNVFRVF